jgi:4-amino-4-deoxy-L-arabinose transferase-like glycosyltransferase
MNTSMPFSWRDQLLQRPYLLACALFALALLLRLVALERYITPDELIWVYRSVQFREALRAGAWADTLVAGHPGVITTWLGTLGISLQLLLKPTDQEVYQWITQVAWLTPDNMAAFQQLSVFLSVGRLAVALVNSLGVVLAYWLAKHLLGSGIGLLVALLLAVDPFLAGLSGLLHVDGLVTTFAVLSLLSLALATGAGEASGRRPSQLSYAILSGAMAALAVLTKSPALLLVPFSALIFLLGLFRDRSTPFFGRVWKILPLGLAWLGSFLLFAFLLFPALWSSTSLVLQTAGSNANRHVAEALRPTFFLGKVAYDHGLLFYPIALAWRLGPVVSVGLVLLLVLLIRRSRRRQLPLFVVLLLGIWIVLFVVAISLAAKKFDRYALPVIPAFTLLAAIAWAVWLRPPKRRKQLLLVGLLAVQILAILWVWPYPLASYNPLLGGQFSAQYVLPLGWGESISTAGRWLAGESQAEQKTAVSGIAPSLAPFFPGETLLAEEAVYETVDFLVYTANSRQVDAQAVDQATKDLELQHTIRYGGLDQSWIYRNPTPRHEDVVPQDLAQPINFGDKMQLLGQDLRTGEGNVNFTARWERQQPEGRFLVKLRLVDQNGQVWDHLETALLNEVYFRPQHWQEEETPIVTYILGLPLAIPPGNYELELSLVDEVSNAQIPVLAQNGSFHGVAYNTGDVVLPMQEQAIDPARLDMIAANNAAWLDGSLLLLGYPQLPERVTNGASLTLDLFWQAAGSLPDNLMVSVQLGQEEPELFPLSSYDSGLWPPGMIVQEKYSLPVPEHMEAGQVSLMVRPLFADGQPPVEPAVTLGHVQIAAINRLFTLPDDIEAPLFAHFEPGITLHGANPGEIGISPGESLDLTLYWQAEARTEEPVTAFVHLLDDQGNIVAQADRWPGGLPSNIWAGGQVIVDEYEVELPPMVAPGTYQIAVGLYTAADGLRLPASDLRGQPYAGDSVILPLIVTVRP